MAQRCMEIYCGANSWSGMSMDEKTGIVYIPTGSASPDFYGGNVKEKLFANSTGH